MHGEFGHGFETGGVGVDGGFEAVVDVLGEFDGAGGIGSREMGAVDRAREAEELHCDPAFVHVFEALLAALSKATVRVRFANVRH